MVVDYDKDFEIISLLSDYVLKSKEDWYACRQNHLKIQLNVDWKAKMRCLLLGISSFKNLDFLEALTLELLD